MDMVSVHDLDGNIRYLSPAALELTGYSVEELQRGGFRAHLPFLKDQEAYSNAFKGMSDGESQVSLTFRFRTKGGMLRWFETRMKKIDAIVEGTGQLLLVTREVSERMATEEEVKKLSLIARQTSNSVVITDIDGKITFVNPGFEIITGYRESEVMGRKPGDFLQGEETDPAVVAVMRQAIAAFQPFSVEVINYSKSGKKYWLRIFAEPMLDFEGQRLGFFSIQYDISQQKEYEAKIDQLNQQLKRQNDRLEESNSALQDFAYVASHDLKAPLRQVIGLAELIMRKRELLTPDKLEELLEVIYKASRDMNQMIEGLLEYARSGIVNEELQSVALNPLFAAIQGIFEEEIRQSHADFILHAEVDSVTVYPVLFKRLLINLVGNALKYRSEANPIIQVSCTREQDGFLIAVTDNGIGIPADRQEAIFKRFARLNMREDSNGIGLWACKKIVELHNGSISVDSQVGKGTTFSVRVPLLTGD